MIIILMGVSGSGKTEIGRRLAAGTGWTFCDADDLHSVANREKMSRGEALTESDREPWLQSIAERVRAWLGGEEDAILACSALTRGSRSTIGADAPGVRLVYLKGDYALIEQRIRSRQGHFFSPDLLRSQFDTLEEPEDAVVVDVGAEPGEVVARIVQALGLRGEEF